jgi:hypothetical protein
MDEIRGGWKVIGFSIKPMRIDRGMPRMFAFRLELRFFVGYVFKHRWNVA